MQESPWITWYEKLTGHDIVEEVRNSVWILDKTTRIWTEELQKENGKRVRKFKTERKLEEW